MPIEKDIILQVIITIGGVVAGWFGYKLKNKINHRDDFKIITDIQHTQIVELQIENKNLEKENRFLFQKILDHEKALSNLNLELRVIQSSYFESPIPMWVKDEKGVLRYANKSYEQAFYLPSGRILSDCLGKNDIEIWGEETGHQFREHDEYVRQSGNTWIGNEVHIENGHDLLKNYYFLKYPFDPNGLGIIRGHVAGIAMPLTDEIIKYVKAME